MFWGIGRQVNYSGPGLVSRCSVCKGTGRDTSKRIHMPCTECNGTGLAQLNLPFSVKVLWTLFLAVAVVLIAMSVIPWH